MHKVVFLFLGVAICGFAGAESSAPQPARFRNAAPLLGLAELGVNSYATIL